MSELTNIGQRLEYLANRLTSMYVSRIDGRQLGNIAIEIMMTRVNIEHVLDGSISRTEKRKAKKLLQKIKEIEKRTVSLFLLTEVAKARTSDTLTPFYDYVKGSFKQEEYV